MYSGLVRCYSTTEKKKYNKAVQRDKVKMDKIEIDAHKKFHLDQDKRGKKGEEELWVIHFYGSRTHYLLIRADTFFSV